MVFLVFTAWLILSQVMISLVQAFFASAGYGFLAGITYAAQAGAHVVFIWIFRSHLPHAAGKKEAGLRNGLQMVLFSAMTGIGLCMAHRVLFFLFPQIAQSTLGQMTAEEQSRILNSARTPAYFLYAGLIGPVLEELVFRGILFNCCSGKYGRWYPVFITALLFAVFHRNPVQFASAICMGLVLGSLLTLTGDIRITMMIHISNNVFSVMQSLFVKSGPEFSLSPAGIIASVLMGFLFLVWGFVQIKKRWSRGNPMTQIKGSGLRRL